MTRLIGRFRSSESEFFWVRENDVKIDLNPDAPGGL